MSESESSNEKGLNLDLLDRIGPWSEVKLDIIERYAKEYSKIINNNNLEYYYIDAFSGSGLHITKETEKIVLGSPLKALKIKPPFHHYYFIDLDSDKADNLNNTIGNRQDVDVIKGDCNEILLDIFPKIKYKEYKRALCLLDPYGIHLNWDVVKKAGGMKTIEIFLNFSIFDINLNLVKDNPDQIKKDQIVRMDKFWGDHSWYDHLYQEISIDLFNGTRGQKIAKANKVLPKAYKKRLKEIAGFKHVPDPIPMRNNSGSELYYLFFATHNPVARRIVEYIFNKWGNK